jgi:hypothetical protein
MEGLFVFLIIGIGVGGRKPSRVISDKSFAHSISKRGKKIRMGISAPECSLDEDP